MNDQLRAFVAESLAAPLRPEIERIATTLGEEAGARAVLFYGSNLRSGALDGVLDFYVLTDGPRERGLWPLVGYREMAIGGGMMRAKIATMRLATFRAAVKGRTIDTTIWARFVQPAAFAWSTDAAARDAVVEAVAAAAITAGRYAAALGPAAGDAGDYWGALFRATYAAEFRVESGRRGDEIVAHDPARYNRLLPLAWDAAGIAYTAQKGELRPQLADRDRAAILRRWRWVRRWGRPLNVARLVRAAFTFDGAARYAAWKIERHTGVPVPLTPWRERHPVLAAPGVLWRVWRAQRG